MANQIAANMDYGRTKKRSRPRAADHLKRFWNSTMRAAVIEGHSKKLLDLSPVAARAVEIPRRSQPVHRAEARGRRSFTLSRDPVYSYGYCGNRAAPRISGDVPAPQLLAARCHSRCRH
jgi:hypothetical protein